MQTHYVIASAHNIFKRDGTISCRVTSYWYGTGWGTKYVAIKFDSEIEAKTAANKLSKVTFIERLDK